MLRLGAKFVLSFAWRCPSHFLLVSLCSSFLSSPESPALCRAVTCGLVLSVPDSARASSCLSFLFPEGLFQSRAELASGVVRSPPPPHHPGVLLAFAVGRLHSHVAFESPSILAGS